jgi:hypothetical protein
MTCNGLPPCPPYDPCDACGHIELSENVNPCRGKCTVGDLHDVKDNIWFQPQAPGAIGRCILDEMTYEQVYLVLERYPLAKRDMYRITTNPHLIRLANTVQLMVNEHEDNQIVVDRFNRGTLPYYTLFRGNTDGTPR